MTAAAYDFRFGDMDFSPTAQTGTVEFHVLGLKRGKPVPVAVVAESMMRDGADERVDHWENRDQSVLIGMKGPDSEALAQAELDLWLECQKRRNELAWTPPDGFGATTVFDVLWADLEFVDDSDDWDLKELHGFQVWRLSPRVLPFGRSDTEVIEAGLVSAAVPSTTVIQDGSSATNWVGTPGTVTSSSGFLTQSSAPTATHSGAHTYTVTHRYAYTPGSAVDMSATTYLTVDYRPIVLGTSNDNRVTAYADGSVLVQVAEVALASPAGWRRVTFLCPDTSVATFWFDAFSRQIFPADGTGGPTIAGMATAIDNVQKTNQAPSLSTTGRESVRSFTVQGSARTEGRLQVSHATGGLGDVALHSSPLVAAGNSPDLRRWRTAGGTVTTDATTVSGSREGVSAAVTFNVPASLLPEGGYLLYALMRSTSSPVTLSPTWTAATKIGSTTFASQSGTAAAVTLVSTWTLVPIGGMVLPTVDVPASTAATVQITFTGAANTEYDEAFLFYAGDDSALTIVSCGTGTPAAGTVHNRLWLDTATLDSPRDAIYVGTQSDRSDAFHAGTLAAAWQVPDFVPGDMNLFVVATGAANVMVTLAHFPRFHTHATATA